MKTPSVEPNAPSLPAAPNPLSLPAFAPGSREPIRAELYGLESLEAHARTLAEACRGAARTRTGGPLLRRLTHNERLLVRVHRHIAAVSARKEALSPDAEWLLDNFHVVEDVLREVRHDLPRRYYNELPKLPAGVLTGYPRVYALALDLIAHTDSSLDEMHLTRFVQAFQTVVPLTIGELWAVPTMLRLGLIENLARLAQQMQGAWREYRQAEEWVAPLLLRPAEGETAAATPQPPALDEPPTDTFIVHALQVLRKEGTPDALMRVERLLTSRGVDLGAVVRRENQRQAVNQVSVGNCITSLRLLAALDWGEFFERTNPIEPILREGPAGAYARQDFATRDRCRKVVEKLARHSRFTEVAVARHTVDLARANQTVAHGPPTDHVGYYLLGPGLGALKAEVGYRPPLSERLLDALLNHPATAYFGSITFLTLLLLALFVAVAAATVGPLAIWAWFVVVAAAFLPVSELAVGLTNSLLTLVLPPRTLPKLDFRDGIPSGCATFVVIPSMLVRPESAATLLGHLEIHYLANTDPHLYFALLTDFADAPAEHQPGDEELVRAALDGVRALNERYASGGPPRFFLFHRKRQWNPVQGCWMGWERKRGKLEEFNRLLRGDRATSYSVTSTDIGAVPAVRYVITLDADTQLPREAARRLVGTIAHPLNRARLGPCKARVVEGYAVLQPRVSFLLPAANRSRFTRIWVSSAGIDPYSMAVSDIYQDLFGEGTFTGKGIYDVDAFAATAGRAFPDNHILSHDLIEGNFARCGLVTDIELFDDFPSRYHAYARRDHRWVRGDWQLLPWLGRTLPVRGAGGAVARRRNPLPAVARWKVIDNLRRSLVPPALVLWLLLSWTFLPVPLGLSSALALLVLGLPLVLQLLGAAVQSVRGLSLAPLRELRYHVGPTFGQVVLDTVFLLYRACYTSDAIVRTLARLCVTRRRLLEWETAASAERRLGNCLRHYALSMWQAPALAVVLAVLVALFQPTALVAAGWFLAAWLLSPLVAYWVSQAPAVRDRPLTAAERRELHLLARRTWGFFEKFVGDADHWLPPDNFQEEPRGQVAHRTSPTNQGLLLLSTLAAHDLGYLSLTDLADRLEKTLDTLDRLERYRGHFFNWYDTQTLQPLPPAYVSTVDSGNLLGCLLTLEQGLREKADESVLGPRLVEGLADTLGVLAGLVQDVRTDISHEVAALPRLLAAVRAVGSLLDQRPADLPAWAQWLGRVGPTAAALVKQAEDFSVLYPSGKKDAVLWASRLAAQVRHRQAELDALAPWLRLLAEPEGQRCAAALAGGPEAGRWDAVCRRLTGVFALAGFPAQRDGLASDLAELQQALVKDEQQAGWLRRLRNALVESSATALLDRCCRLAGRVRRLGSEMDFRFLYKPDRHLFALGYHVPDRRLDAPCYDLLASEARLASFLAIARGDAPRRHWFCLGRLLTRVSGRLCLLSWGGTMFEYLMPQLLLRNYPGTLVTESCAAAVDRQREYGRQRGVPWGISESAYSSQYASYDYQYLSFGVPGLGLKRGLGRDLVVAPYATALAAMVEPHEAVRNFRSLAAEGAAGRYGFYEAIDYTRDRLPQGRRSLVVRCFMAHHQGMSLVALTNCLLDEPMPRRFHAEPMVRATELLLQERLPWAATPIEAPHHEEVPRPAVEEGPGLLSRRLTTALTPGPRTHLLSGCNYSVMLTNAGAGFSRCKGMDVTRWREDSTSDGGGQFFYVRDLRKGRVWSAAYQPVCRPADEYEVIYSADKAEFRRLDGRIATHLEVTVSPENCAEIRRVTLINHDRRRVELELTSYVEVVLAPHGADLSHPAFGKLFLETEWVPAHNALLCRRRPRGGDQKPLWAAHVAAADAALVGEIEFETDRARFLGRGRSPAAPAALDPGARLSGTTGPVLDPIFSLRRRIRLAPGASASVVFCTLVAGSREEALALADHYHDAHAILRVFDLAWAHSQIELRHLNLSSADAHQYQRLATHLLYAGAVLRAPVSVLTANRRGQPDLWRHGISGDRPIALVRVGDVEDLPLVRQLLAAHAYWRYKGLEVDLVILSDRPASYYEELFNQLQQAVRASDSHAVVDRPGGVFVRQTEHLSKEDLVLLQAAARLVLTGSGGALGVQVDRLEAIGKLPDPLVPSRAASADDRAPSVEQRAATGLTFFNGLGGFTPDGSEYCILPSTEAASRGSGTSASLALPPAPWVNVIANPACGCLVSESALGCVWIGNSQQNRLTPWNNDPVSDPPSAVVYLRDEMTGEVWTPTPRPLGTAAATLVRHAQGHTVFQRHSHGLAHELLVFVPTADALQIVALTVHNEGNSQRSLSATFYAEWVLGAVRDQAAMNVRTEVDADTEALLAHNVFNADFAAQVAFADVNVRPRTVTGDRTEFLGRHGSVAAPAALARVELSGRVGPAVDPCAALQVKFELAPGEQREVCFVLGAAADLAAARDLVRHYREPGRVRAAFEEVQARWEHTLTAVQVQTPDPALDLLVNRWLVYQVLSCRLWGRSGFYQSSGAYGFRDQLQDVMAVVYCAPEEARAHILRAAGRQFLEGDVQHWWHPPAGRGVRTRISDDFLWLPFVVCHYVRVSGDATVLDERVPYLKAARLAPNQEEDYGLPEVAEKTGTVYDHCVRALDNGLHFGAHGLPLMGTGDWNDGMNRVGAGGKGESVWNAWFLCACLRRFTALAEARGDTAWAATCRAEAERLRGAVEATAWDGRWYRRAYFDDGTPLGSAENDECQIDSIVQSWAVLSGAGDPGRTRTALAAADERLVRPHDGVILLLAPPFDHGRLEPGYIKGYVPGIRENSGQYTHAATWTVQATALLRQGTRAAQLFNLLNPIHHAATAEQVARYRVEPYVLAGDVYGAAPHVGRGGWTWYTGSAAWLYRVALETILGLEVEGHRLRLDPCIPASWGSFHIRYRYRSATYLIRVDNQHGVEHGVTTLVVDGQARPDGWVELVDDSRQHEVHVVMGAQRGAEERYTMGNV
jgi:cyclic beta-1,2-glucan synthetase